MNIIEYSNLLLSSNYKKLLIVNPTRVPQIKSKQISIYEKALNRFAL